jgi:hypothetical protein
MATLYSIDGTTTEIAPNNGTDFTGNELRQFMGVSWLEALYVGGVDGDEHSNQILIVDEEGKLNGSPVNENATQVYQAATGSTDVIVGNAVLTTTEFFK